MERYSNKTILSVFFMILIAFLAFSLAVWQINRAIEKKEFLEKFDSRGKQTIKLNKNSSLQDYSNPESWDQRKLLISGSWVPSSTIYLDNRSFDSRPGVHVITAFILNDNKSVVWVNRGWAPKLPGKIIDNTKFIDGESYLPINKDEITNIEGIAHTDLMKRIELTTNSLILRNGSLWQNLNWSALSSKLKNDPGFYFEKTWPFILWQTTNSLDGLKRSLPRIKVDVNKHVGYAVQWVLLCLVSLFFAWRIGRN